jgi:hypothetical protein
MKRSNFLKSLAALIAAPSVLVEVAHNEKRIRENIYDGSNVSFQTLDESILWKNQSSLSLDNLIAASERPICKSNIFYWAEYNGIEIEVVGRQKSGSNVIIKLTNPNA